MDAIAKVHGVDKDKFYSTPGKNPVEVNETTMQMITATSRGDAELYYPPVYGISSRLGVLIRNIWPSLVHYDEAAVLTD